MKNLFHTEAYQEILQRLDSLTPESQPLWGKMNVAQMLAHCSQVIRVPLQKIQLASFPWPFKWAFRLFKSTLYNDRPWKKGTPTAAEFKIVDPKDFDQEKLALQALIQEFHQLPAEALPIHPLGVKLTVEQWGKSQYKHLDHHLRQFGK